MKLLTYFLTIFFRTKMVLCSIIFFSTERLEICDVTHSLGHFMDPLTGFEQQIA